jgi:hypothetical protein
MKRSKMATARTCDVTFHKYNFYAHEMRQFEKKNWQPAWIILLT